VSKEDRLKLFTEDQLKEIAHQEGISKIPKTFDKKDLIKFLEGVLTLEQIKTYEGKYSEKEIERDIHIHEKIREKSIEKKAETTTKLNIDRNKTIVDLSKTKIDKTIIEAIADDLHEEIPSGSGVKYFDGMSLRLLKALDGIFIIKEEDRTGRYFEYLSANWLWKKYSKNATSINFRQKLPKIGEIDIILYDNNDFPYVIGECKDRQNVKIEDIDKWLSNSDRIIQEFGDEMIKKNASVLRLVEIASIDSYFFSSTGFTQGIIDRLKENEKVENGIYTAKKKIGSKYQVKLHLVDVRNNQFKEVYPT
jgi:hypothetical protein